MNCAEPDREPNPDGLVRVVHDFVTRSRGLDAYAWMDLPENAIVADLLYASHGPCETLHENSPPDAAITLVSASLYFHTIRYLRPVQIYGRIRFRLQMVAPDLSPPPFLRTPGAAGWASACQRASGQRSALGFRFLNQEHEVRTASDWNNLDWGKLWLYNLHYCDELNTTGSQARRIWHELLVRKWIAENPPGQGVGWEPYPLSLRIVNWIKWSLAGGHLPAEGLHSLAVQVRYLTRRLEFHLLGNHLFANAKALVFGGVFFAGPEADGWLHTGLEILMREVREQVLADGGHFERSPMYHAIIFEDLLDVLNLLRAYSQALPEESKDLSQEWRARAQAMLRWMRTMTHPDGDIALFNDSALGIACRPADLQRYAHRLDLANESPLDDIVHLADSGYVRLQKDIAAAFLDIGPIGPDYLPGHAHADTLSFELSVGAHRVLVDSGTSIYEPGPERIRQRSTAAHNTVEIDGASSSEVWGSFRVARRAYPIDLELLDRDRAVHVRCAHDGYRRLAGRPLHRREWIFRATGMTVIDTVEGAFGTATARFHFHPDCTLQQGDEHSGAVSIAGKVRLRWRLPKCRGRIVDTTYHPEFGLSIPNECLEVELVGSRAQIDIEWYT